MGGFASHVVTSTSDPRLLADLLPHLEAAAEAAPEGGPRWCCLCYLADALRSGGRPDASLPFYEQAAAQARTAAEVGGENGRQAWADVALDHRQLGQTLSVMIGDLDAARQRHLESAEAEKKAGNPAIKVIRSELEALRIDIIQGKVEAGIAGRGGAAGASSKAGGSAFAPTRAVPEASDAESLARAIHQRTRHRQRHPSGPQRLGICSATN